MKWIRLRNGKERSRLLYPNPVCFLCRSTIPTNSNITCSSTRIQKIQTGTQTVGNEEEYTPNSTIKPKKEDETPESYGTETVCGIPFTSRLTTTTTTQTSTTDNYVNTKEPLCCNDGDATIPACTFMEQDACDVHACSDNVMVLSWLTATDNSGRFVCSINRRRYTASLLRRSVLSNRSSFGYSTTTKQTEEALAIQTSPPNRSTILTNSPQYFVLAVPVAGMEQLVLSVGSSSGRFGCKFESNTPFQECLKEDTQFENQYDDSEQDQRSQNNETLPHKRKQQLNSKSNNCCTNTSNRSAVRGDGRPSTAKHHGSIPGLHKMPVGGGLYDINYRLGIPSCTSNSRHSSAVPMCFSENDQNLQMSSSPSTLFAIEGTVAHLVCRVDRILDLNDDDDSNDQNDQYHLQPIQKKHQTQNHMLVFAKIVDAYVLENYWDSKKCLFRPSPASILTTSMASPHQSLSPPPYMTFFGSQQFGYTTTTAP